MKCRDLQRFANFVIAGRVPPKIPRTVLELILLLSEKRRWNTTDLRTNALGEFARNSFLPEFIVPSVSCFIKSRLGFRRKGELEGTTRDGLFSVIQPKLKCSLSKVLKYVCSTFLSETLETVSVHLSMYATCFLIAHVHFVVWKPNIVLAYKRTAAEVCPLDPAAF